MKRVLALLLVFLVADAAIAAKKVTRETIVLRGVERTYYQALPEEIEPGESLPLVLAFHGSGRNGDSVVEAWAKLAKRKRLIVIGLDSVDPQQWQMPADGPDPVHELVEALRQKLPIDLSRMYLLGHSGGAVFALRLAMLESDYFAAVAVHAGSFRTGGDFATIDSAKRKVPVLIIVGDRDQFFPLATVEATVQAMKRAGVPAQAEIMRGHDHWYYTLATSIDARAWEFLRQQQLVSGLATRCTFSGSRCAPDPTRRATRAAWLGFVRCPGARVWDESAWRWRALRSGPRSRTTWRVLSSTWRLLSKRWLSDRGRSSNPSFERTRVARYPA